MTGVIIGAAKNAPGKWCPFQQNLLFSQHKLKECLDAQ
jgi:hypothetical protein